MALGITRSSSEDYAPSLRINSVSGDVIIAGSKKAADGVSWDKYETEVKLPARFIFDMAEIKVGFMHFSTSGPSFALVKFGEKMPPKPSEEHKPGFQVRCFSKEHGICVLANSSKTVGEAMDYLHDQYLREEKANAGKVPVVEIAGMEKVSVSTREGKKNYRKPSWKIVAWVPKPEAMEAKSEAPVSEALPEEDSF